MLPSAVWSLTSCCLPWTRLLNNGVGSFMDLRAVIISVVRACNHVTYQSTQAFLVFKAFDHLSCSEFEIGIWDLAFSMYYKTLAFASQCPTFSHAEPSQICFRTSLSTCCNMSIRVSPSQFVGWWNLSEGNERALCPLALGPGELPLPCWAQLTFQE